MTHEIGLVLVRDLRALRTELRTYPSEELLWSVPPGISNSAGTLALHIVGNLQHYVGSQLGGTGYARDRTAEFSDRNVPLTVLEHRIEETIKAVKTTMAELEDPALDRLYPLEVGGQQLTTRLFLTHLVSHTAYHLGQIDYHKRLITGINRPAGLAMAGLNEAT
jgi:uncharacterized damage-inducible protein DinB